MSTLLRFLVWTAIALGLVLGLLRLTILRTWRVPTNDPVLESSLAPTLSGGDLIVLARLTTPSFGDLVQCPEPDAPGRVVVGRIVGQASDTVILENGAPIVNGRRFATERVCDPGQLIVSNPDDGSEVTQHCAWEVIANKLHMVATVDGHLPPHDHREVLVPPGHVFLLSDNRLFPYDSRDYGPVPAEGCREIPVLRLVSRKGWADAGARFTFLQ